jgi:ribonuclease Z
MAANQTISMRPFKPPTVETTVQDNFHPAMKVNVPVQLPPWTAKKFKIAKKSVVNASRRGRRRTRSPGSGKNSSGSESDSSPSRRRGRDVGVLPLGTGSAAPSKYRNGTFDQLFSLFTCLTRAFPVSSTLISIPGWGNVLLDAGEGTWGQLVRQYGPGQGPTESNSATSSDVWQVLRDLKCIFISHMHADHHIGLANILAKRKLVSPWSL